MELWRTDCTRLRRTGVRHGKIGRAHRRWQCGMSCFCDLLKEMSARIGVTRRMFYWSVDNLNETGCANLHTRLPVADCRVTSFGRELELFQPSATSVSNIRSTVITLRSQFLHSLHRFIRFPTRRVNFTGRCLQPQRSQTIPGDGLSLCVSSFIG